MLHFIDVYLQTKIPLPLNLIHELEHRIFLIPNLANLHDDRHSKTNGMSYSRGIRFSLVTNNVESIKNFKNFFLNIASYMLPEWTPEKKERFEVEENEWRVRQREYFGSFATSIFEEEFDKINNIQSDIILHKNILQDIFSGIRICENFALTEVLSFHSQKWEFPIISRAIDWEQEGAMQAMILPVSSLEYSVFIFVMEWVKTLLKRELQYA